MTELLLEPPWPKVEAGGKAHAVTTAMYRIVSHPSENANATRGSTYKQRRRFDKVAHDGSRLREQLSRVASVRHSWRRCIHVVCPRPAKDDLWRKGSHHQRRMIRGV
jgi:hypothetical protein